MVYMLAVVQQWGIGNNATEYLRISNSGNLNLWKGNLILWSPTYSITFNTSSLGANNIYYLPNKTGVLAMTSDISTLAATVSAISLQTVTNVGATTSRPVTMSSSLSVGSTFSIGSDFIFSNKQETVNIDTIIYSYGASYVITGVSSAFIFYHRRGISSASINTYGDITVPANCSIIVEATFNSTSSMRNSSGVLNNGYWRQNKVIGNYTVNASGVISLQNLSTEYTYSYDIWGISNDGSIDISTAYAIKFRQTVNNPGASTNYDTVSRVEYKIFISSYTAV